jgi:acetyl esterase/lipase
MSQPEIKGSDPSEIPFDVYRPQLNMLRPDEICLAFHGAGATGGVKIPSQDDSSYLP